MIETNTLDELYNKTIDHHYFLIEKELLPYVNGCPFCGKIPEIMDGPPLGYSIIYHKIICPECGILKEFDLISQIKYDKEKNIVCRTSDINVKYEKRI